MEPAARNVRPLIVVCRTLGNCSRCVRAGRSQCLLGMSAIRRWGRRPSTAEPIHATIWRSTSPAWIVCAQTRTASGGWWASQSCGLSPGNQRQIGQRRWAQIGDDDTGKPNFNQGSVLVVQATQYRRCNQRLINWRQDRTPDAAEVAQRSDTPGYCPLNLRPHGQVIVDKEPTSCTIVQQRFNCYCRETIDIFCRRHSMQCP